MIVAHCSEESSQKKYSGLILNSSREILVSTFFFAFLTLKRQNIYRIDAHRLEESAQIKSDLYLK